MRAAFRYFMDGLWLAAAFSAGWFWFYGKPPSFLGAVFFLAGCLAQVRFLR